jgi:hypothetical protein
MLDFKTQSQLVDATASIMRAYFKAATNTVAASTSRSLSLWSEMVEAASPGRAPAPQPRPEARSPGFPSWPSPADWMVTPRPSAPWSAPWSGWPWLAGSAPGMSWAPLAQTWWLGPSVTFWAPLADWGAWSRGSLPAWSGWNSAVQVPSSGATSNGAAHPAPDPGFASYRSAGGHAVAQVIVPAMELASITATTALSPMQTMLGVWRAALRA